MSAISEKRFNSVSALLGIILLFNVAAAAATTTIPPSVDPKNTNMSTNVPTKIDTPTTYSPIPTLFLVPTTNKPTHGPFSCENAIAKNISMNQFLGLWFEAARKTNVSNNQSCNDFNFKKETNHISVTSEYSTNPLKLWMHNNTCFETHFVGGVFNMTDKDGVNTFKILETDYKNYAFMCSYRVNNNPIPTIPTTTPTKTTTTTTTTKTTTALPSTAANSTAIRTNTTTATTASTPVSTKTTTSSTTNTTTTTTKLSPTTGSTTAPTTTSTTAPKPEYTSTNAVFILVRSRSLSSNNTFMTNLKTKAQYKYSDFKNLTTVNQSDECIKKNSASTLMPMLTMIMTVVLAAVSKF